jgi:hypothetical protein
MYWVPMVRKVRGDDLRPIRDGTYVAKVSNLRHKPLVIKVSTRRRSPAIGVFEHYAHDPT